MVSRPRGTRDFAPDEMARRHWAAKRMRGVFERYGYGEVQTPSFEELELFTAKSGPGIISELYDFEDKAGRKMTLRPELTAPVMRMYHAEHAFDPKPIKWFYFGSCFRYDRPQAGRYREFWQFGCELIGAGTPLAYAELIALADGLFDAVGLKTRELAVGHVGLLRTLVDRLPLTNSYTTHVPQGDDHVLDDSNVKTVQQDSKSAFMRLLDKKAYDQMYEDLEHYWKGGDTDENRSLLDRFLQVVKAPSVDALPDSVRGAPEVEELEACMEHLGLFGVEAQLDLGIARGLDYYTSIVFECHSPVLGAQSQLLGGGGYDLSAVFGAQPTPTLGFGLGFDRTLVALAEEGVEVPVEPGPQLYVGALGEAQPWLSQQVQALRRAGVAVEMDLLGRKPGQIAKAADASGARFLAIVGDRDMEAGHVAVKDLKTGETQDVGVEDLQAWVVQHLGLDLGE